MASTRKENGSRGGGGYEDTIPNTTNNGGDLEHRRTQSQDNNNFLCNIADVNAELAVEEPPRVSWADESVGSNKHRRQGSGSKPPLSGGKQRHRRRDSQDSNASGGGHHRRSSSGSGGFLWGSNNNGPPPPPRQPLPHSSQPLTFLDPIQTSPGGSRAHHRIQSVDWAGALFATSPTTKTTRKTTTNEPPSTQQKQEEANGPSHGRTRSFDWAGSLFGRNNKHITPEKAKEDYHKLNQQFLHQAEKARDQQAKKQRPGGRKPPLPPSSSSSRVSPIAPVRAGSGRMLYSVEEDDDEGETDETSPKPTPSQPPTIPSLTPLGPKNTEERRNLLEAQHPIYDDANDNDDDDDSVSSMPRHLNSSFNSSDEWSVDSYGSSAADSYYSNGGSRVRSERLAKFERDQEERFLQKKSSMEKELYNVLERNNVKSHREKQEFINAYMIELEKERERLVAQWKEEWQKEEEYLRQQDPKRKLLNDLYNLVGSFLDAFILFLSSAEVFISNMPLTIAALALSWVSMGCVWFKFMEENVSSCHHVHFYSPQCTFPEFPGCFECDTSNDWYWLGEHFHYLCSIVSVTFCSMILLKVVLAWDVVVDELSNPTTATPCGVFCIAMVCDFAGRGTIGEVVVVLTASFHFILAFWFLYMAIVKYRLYPEPSWFPNTVGISYAAVKSFVYFPRLGQFLMGICLTFFVGIFFISVIRVATNPKISPQICWFQLSAPSITLYAVTLIPQPTKRYEDMMAEQPELKAHFVDFLRSSFLPLHHALFACTIIGLISAIHGVLSRFDRLKSKPFSPAHVAFCAPTLGHTNAVQAYISTVDALSNFGPDSFYRRALYSYWCVMLFTGTIVNLIFTYKFLSRLPEWTKVDISGEDEPPAPSDTMVHEMLDDRGAHEVLLQSFVSPAVLEANEAGALVRVRRGTEDYRRYGPYVRTRNVTARGFDPSLNNRELREERAALLDWCAKNAPRQRHRTMSVPGVLHLRDKAGRGVYGTFLGGGSSSADSDSGGEAGGVSESVRMKHSRSRTSVDGFWG